MQQSRDFEDFCVANYGKITALVGHLSRLTRPKTP